MQPNSRLCQSPPLSPNRCFSFTAFKTQRTLHPGCTNRLARLGPRVFCHKRVLNSLARLPPQIGGIGRVAERVLASFGITTCGQLVVRDDQHASLSVAYNPRSPPQWLRTQENCGTIGALFSPITLNFYLVRKSRIYDPV